MFPIIHASPSLSDTYEFDLKQATNKGVIAYINHQNSYQVSKAGQKLDKSDLLDLAQLAFEQKKFDKTVLLMQEAKR